MRAQVQTMGPELQAERMKAEPKTKLWQGGRIPPTRKSLHPKSIWVVVARTTLRGLARTGPHPLHEVSRIRAIDQELSLDTSKIDFRQSLSRFRPGVCPMYIVS